MSERNMRKTTVGKVVSNKMDKTIVVAVEDSYRLRFTTRSSSVPLREKPMTKRTSAASATECVLWKLVPSLRIRDGAWLRLSRKPNNRL